MPLESIHSLTFNAAVATRCAAEQGKYWEMRTQHWSNPQTLGDTMAHAKAVGLDQNKFYVCVGEGKAASDIRQDMAQAEELGVRGTPTFLLATVGTGGQLKVQRMLQGGQPYSTFKAQIDALLASQ